MVPAQVVSLACLPLNHNGKVDRAALPLPGAPAPAAAAPARPATEMEEKVQSLWARVLGCRVGPEDNFFDLGGSSLQLLEVHAELKKWCGGELAVTELFEHPTVRALARRLAGRKASPGPAFTQTQERARRQQEAFARQRLLKGAPE
jgi:acyl carrier protein